MVCILYILQRIRSHARALCSFVLSPSTRIHYTTQCPKYVLMISQGQTISTHPKMMPIKHMCFLEQGTVCLPSFDCNWGKQNDLTAHWHQLHPQYWVLQQENVSATHHIVWAFPQFAWVVRWLSRSLYLGQRVAERPSSLLPIFMGLSLTPITDTWGKYFSCHHTPTFLLLTFCRFYGRPNPTNKWLLIYYRQVTYLLVDTTIIPATWTTSCFLAGIIQLRGPQFCHQTLPHFDVFTKLNGL